MAQLDSPATSLLKALGDLVIYVIVAGGLTLIILGIWVGIKLLWGLA